MCEGLYHSSQFNFIAYHSSGIGGQLYNADSMVRVNYYSASALPEVDFDATQEMVGAGSDYQDGHYYTPIINSHLAQTSPVNVDVPQVSFSTGNAYVDVTVTLEGELASIANTYVRVAVLEDVTFNGELYHNVVRDMVPTPLGTPLTIQHTGEVQELHLPFTMGTWNPANMAVVAFVQRDSDKYIYNSGSSLDQPYFVIASVAGSQQIIASGGPQAFGTTTITNYGTESDTYDISIDPAGLPAGWTAYFTHNGVQMTNLTIDLDQFEAAQVVVTVVPSGAGGGAVNLDIFSHGAGEILTNVTYRVIDGSSDVLVVADDGSETYVEDFVVPAVVAAGKTASVWDYSFSPVSAAALTSFDTVIWLCGSTSPGLIAADRAAVDAFINAGGNILISGQDIASDMQTEGGSARVWFQLRTHSRYISSNSHDTSLSGVAGDPISDGMSFAIAGGDGANNQSDPDVIQILDAYASPILNFSSGSLAGTRVETDTYKMVYLAFGFEGIATTAARNQLMTNILTWFGGSTPVGGTTPRAVALGANAPNPFNPSTKIAFALATTGPINLAVYDLQGRLVRTLADEVLPAGDHARTWDGRTDSGSLAASGTYVYRLTAEGKCLANKMTLLK